VSFRFGINGLGRIGRAMVRLLEDEPSLTLAAINDLASPEILAPLITRDSIYGPGPRARADGPSRLLVNGRPVDASRCADPGEIPWGDSGVQAVIEATGLFAAREAARKHLRSGVRHVLVTAASPDADYTLFAGLNDAGLDTARHRVISTASCTAQALAPTLRVLQDVCGITEAAMTTVHSYTNHQPTLDGPMPDPRRARAAALSMIPTSTTSIPPLLTLFPALEDRLSGLSIRVPTPAVSLIDLTVRPERSIGTAALHDAFRAASTGPLGRILGTTDEELVSTDFRGEARSTVIDLPMTRVLPGGSLRILSWYDNEWGYANRVLDAIRRVAAGPARAPEGS